MQQNGQFVLIIDFKSKLGGGNAYTDEVKTLVTEAGHTDKIFCLEITYHPKCIFAGLYGIKNAPQLVAVSTHNKMQRTSDVSSLV